MYTYTPWGISRAGLSGLSNYNSSKWQWQCQTQNDRTLLRCSVTASMCFLCVLFWLVTCMLCFQPSSRCATPGLSAATLASLGGTSSRRGSADAGSSYDPDASLSELRVRQTNSTYLLQSNLGMGRSAIKRDKAWTKNCNKAGEHSIFIYLWSRTVLCPWISPKHRFFFIFSAALSIYWASFSFMDAWEPGMWHVTFEALPYMWACWYCAFRPHSLLRDGSTCAL